MTRFTAPIAEQIWDMKYRYKDSEGAALDKTVEDSWRRIARDLAPQGAPWGIDSPVWLHYRNAGRAALSAAHSAAFHPRVGIRKW